MPPTKLLDTPAPNRVTDTYSAFPPPTYMALEALKSTNLEQVTEENYETILNLIAVDFADNQKQFAQKIIAKFSVSPAMVLALFDRTIAAELTSDALVRKAGKARQDAMYKQIKYSASYQNPLAFAELLAYCSSEDPSWAGLARLVGVYSLDVSSVLGTLVDSFMARPDSPEKVASFVAVFEEGPWTTANLLDTIAWRLWHANDWLESLRFATLLVPKTLSFEEVYLLLGPDEQYAAKIQNHWQDELAKSAGASQFSALANAGSLDGPSSSKGPDHSHLEHRQYFCQYLLEQNLVEDAFKIIETFPMIVQMNEKITMYVISGLLAKDPATILENTEQLTLCGPLIGLSFQLVDLLCTQISAMPQQEAIETFRQWILPAISVAEDVRVIDRIWSVLSTFPQDERYSLYTEWQFALPRHYKPVKYAILKAERNVKGILKRVSNENAPKMVALFADQAKLNPYTAFSVFLAQVESYDKIGSLMLEQLSDFTDMAWDVLPLTVLIQLSTGRTQQQGLWDSKWIQALSSFIARLAAKAPKFDCSKLVVFVLKQFHQGKFDNLIIFKDLFTHMGGCIQLNELSMNQIEQISSHKNLSEHAIRQLGGPNPDKSTVDRILSALKDNEIVLEVFLALCYGYRNTLPKNPGDDIGTPKLLSHRLDEFTLVIQQYCALLAKLPLDEFNLLVEPIPELIEKYGVPTQMAMALWRPYFSEKVSKDDYDATSGDIHPQLASIVSKLPPISNAFSNDFFITAWTLKTYDIQKFSRSYDEGHASGNQGIILGAKIHTLALEKCTTRLEAEQSQWFSHPAQPGEPGMVRRMSQLEVLTKVILPRALFSGLDAVFCAMFINKLCRMGTPHFSFMSFLDTLFSESLLFNTLSSCTAYEAENFGLFIDATFYWLLIHTNPSHFNNLSSPSRDGDGKLTVSAALLRQRDSNDGTRESNLDATFSRRDIFFASEKWQRKISKVLTTALQSKEYMTVRNAITVTKLGQSEIFRQTGDAAKIQKQVQEIAKTDPREDIKLAATALAGQLARAVKSKVSRFVNDDGNRRDRDGQSSRRESPQPARDDTPVATASNTPSNATPASPSPMDLIDKRLKRDRESRSDAGESLPERPKDTPGRHSGRGRDDRDGWGRDRRFRSDERERERSDRNERDRGDRNDRDRGDRERGDRNDRDRNDRDRNDRDRGDRNGRNRRDRHQRDRNSRDRRDRDRVSEPPMPPPAGPPPRRDYKRNWRD